MLPMSGLQYLTLLELLNLKIIRQPTFSMNWTVERKVKLTLPVGRFL